LTQAEVDADQTITFFAGIHGPVAEEAARQYDLTFVRIAQLVTFLVCQEAKGSKDYKHPASMPHSVAAITAAASPEREQTSNEDKR